MTPEPEIILSNVAVGYGRRVVLEGVDAAVARADSIGLLGANGSGKTTLLKTLAGILPPLRGKIQFRNAIRPLIGYVPQRESLEHAFLISTLEVVLMGACGRVTPGRFLGKSEHEFALECLERTGTASLARKPFAEISGGQKQRVLIARALMARPEILLLDEPTSGIDPAATSAISELLQMLNSTGLTILMVNHDVPVIRNVARTIWWVRGAKLEIGATSAMLGSTAVEQIPVA